MSQISAEIYGTLEVSVEGASSTITVAIGTPGPAASVTVGTTTTGLAGTSASVVNVGTTAAAVLNFTIPRGDTGATGPAGAAGQGVPVGGTDGQVLAKIDTTDYNTTWVTPFAQQVRNQVRNDTGATLTKGTVVYVTGAAGNKVTVTKAQANGDATSAQTFAVLLENIANNSNGYAVTSGLLENLDTSAFAAGTQVYLSPTTAGTFTSTKPSAPNHLVYVGVIERSHVNQGSMLVRIQNGYELEELHNVAIAGLANNDLLAYDSATTLWKNKTFGTLGLLTSSTAASTYQTLAGMSSYLTTSAAASTYYPLVGNPSGFLTSASLTGYAPLASPAFTGNPTAPTPLTADNDTSIATTAFVKAQGYLTTSPVTSVAGKTGVVTLAVADVSGAAPLASPALTGTPTAPTATAGTSTTQIATTAFVTAVDIVKANIASPTFTGTPAAPTATAGTSTTQLATTAFVTTADNLKANIASPTFTGTPAAPTAAPGTSTTQLATTAFVTAVDILKAPLASPTFTGTVTIPAGASISGYLTTSSAASTYQTLSGMSSYLTTSAAASTYLSQSNAASTYQTLSGMSSYLTTSAAASTYQPIGSYLTDAPSDGSTYGRLNGAWSVVGGGGSVAWGAITGTLSSQTDLQSALDDKLPLAGGAMDTNAEITTATNTDSDSLLAGWGLGVQKTSDNTKGTTLEFDGLDTYDGSSHMVVSPTGLTFPDSTTQTTAALTDAPSDGSTYGRLNGAWSIVAGGTLAADQLTAGVVTANPTSGPTTAGDVLQYNGTDLIWAAGGGGGGLTISTLSNGATSTLNATAPTTGQALTYDGTDLVWATAGGGGGVAWGAITGTLSSQTDLQTALDGKLAAKTVYEVTSNAYTLASTDANNIVYIPGGASGGFPPIVITVPEDATYSFAVGTVIILSINNSVSGSQVDLSPGGFGAPTLLGTTTWSSSTTGNFQLIKVAANTWICT